MSGSAFGAFETKVEALREVLRIPGLSAAIVRDQELVWANGFGMANLERRVRATEGTPYEVASVTKPLSAILLMELVERGVLDLDTPMIDFGVHFPGDEVGAITVRHLLTHTSEGVPGSAYNYSGGRFNQLTAVIERLYEDSFRHALRRHILDPLEMSNSVLSYGRGSLDEFLAALAPDDPERAVERVVQAAATAYGYDADYDVYPMSMPTYAGAAAGLISTVCDLARFAVAIERNELVAAETKEWMFAPTRLNSGRLSRYGLGWFAESRGETRLIWHYGYGACSSLFLMIPEESLALIVLGNTDSLSRPFRLGTETPTVLGSPFALAFFKEFVVRPKSANPLPEIDWMENESRLVERLAQIADPEVRALYERELWSYRNTFMGVGRLDDVARLHRVHSRAFRDSAPSLVDLYKEGRPTFRLADLRAAPLTSEEAARWVGQYVLSARPEDDLPPRIEIRVRDGRLILPTLSTDTLDLLPESADRVVVPAYPGLVLAAEENTGRYDRLTVSIGDAFAGTCERVE